ncbi:MAG: hypothetical protein J6A21_12160 [Lentisphaeria bacterium]|nr:hypothetical protein [Lentisphaeria bacterium]
MNKEENNGIRAAIGRKRTEEHKLKGGVDTTFLLAKHLLNTGKKGMDPIHFRFIEENFSRFSPVEADSCPDALLRAERTLKAWRKSLLQSQCGSIPAILAKLKRHCPRYARKRYVVAGFLLAFRHAKSAEHFYASAPFYGFQRVCRHASFMNPWPGAKVPRSAVGGKAQ